MDYYLSGSQDQYKVKEKENTRYSITNASMKYRSKNIKEFKNYLIRVMCGIGPSMNPLEVTFT